MPEEARPVLNLRRCISWLGSALIPEAEIVLGWLLYILMVDLRRVVVRPSTRRFDG
jgi:hypothetical protein